MNDNKKMNSLVKIMKENPKNTIGDQAKKEFDIYKSVADAKRNKYLFYNTILLSIITVINACIVFSKLGEKSKAKEYYIIKENKNVNYIKIIDSL